jgi:hypothetical protein
VVKLTALVTLNKADLGEHIGVLNRAVTTVDYGGA